ncbi:YCF48-related protein [Psychrobium sp. 1_MG-2023]|uniref:WD40/YVTN/BNR-like repeat-containing protein n=1 Tax=Psychrobium sp. 1_MG-2023 TaxID=3062624 RepID=UPI000C344F37|nr:YCF48-related protein [Psychrobium sp. 1_MG-2023]MDP2560370.1 YCF48-related protein [Psychrobium sp. 1_MG-2023]PKF55480.1 hypothetical protein CW748_13375 [Alteromonadales bacterium alter-6D02]
MFKTKLLLIYTVLSLCSVSSAALAGSSQPLISANKAYMAPLASKAPMMALVNTGKSLVAVGSRGQILIGANEMWQQVAVPTEALLTNVYFHNPLLGWAVGHDATILKTTDGGQTWTLKQQLPELDKPLLDVYFTDELNGFVVGAYGLFSVTADGGETWTNQFLGSLLPAEDIEYLEEVRADSEEDYQFEIASILPHFNRITAISGDRLLLVGELGLIATSSDQGKTWQRQDDIYEGSFFSAIETNKQTLLVAGLRGNLFRLAPESTTWQRITLPNNFSVNQIKQLKDHTIVLALNNGIILSSDDDGQTFYQIGLYKGQDIVDLAELAEQTWFVGSKGISLLEVNR